MGDVKQKSNKPHRGHLWKKGESGNPNGRPKLERTVSQVLRDLGTANDGERLKALCTVLYDMAQQGNIAAVKEIFDRIEGKALQRVADESENSVVLRIGGRIVDLTKPEDEDAQP